MTERTKRVSYTVTPIKYYYVIEAQFLDLVRQNQGIIYKLVALYANDAEEKKDLYQEVLLQAWKGCANFRQDAKFSTWLYRTCLNTIFTQKRKKHRLDYKDSLEAISPAVQNGSVQKEDGVRLQQAIKKLSETDRAIISMNLDGYENSEIGEMLGISNNHVSVKLHRIKQQLANLLTQ
ncbi:MAG: sigma-70 family RNA polymerase sigma factor [Ferruginibacter sp.]|nr:sigma-70 family RNA polymerase sigma factor [Ferruginibacter sp.]